jgi:hypothetical protein
VITGFNDQDVSDLPQRVLPHSVVCMCSIRIGIVEVTSISRSMLLASSPSRTHSNACHQSS